MYLIYHPRILSGFSGVTGQGCPKVYIFKLFPQNRVYRVNVADRVPKHVGNHETNHGLTPFFRRFHGKTGDELLDAWDHLFSEKLCGLKMADP